jgi:hypothetical protein
MWIRTTVFHKWFISSWANPWRNSGLRKLVYMFANFFADLIFFDLQTFRKCGILRICDLWTQLLFADLKLLQIRKLIIFLRTNISLKGSHSTFKDDFWLLGQFWDRIKWKILEQNQIRITAYSLQICGFAICRRGHQGYFRVCDLRINHYKCADLRFADWHTSDICELAIAECAQEFPDLRFAD